MEFSRRAGLHLSRKEYSEALLCYERSIKYYEQQESARMDQDFDIDATAVLHRVNVASCHRNMGAIYRQTKRYQSAIQSWKQAEHLYRKILENILSVAHNELPSIHGSRKERLCVEALWIETLQSTASILADKLDDLSAAIQAHLTCLGILLEAQPYETIVGGVHCQGFDVGSTKKLDLLQTSTAAILRHYDLATMDCDVERVHKAISALQKSGLDEYQTTVQNGLIFLANTYLEEGQVVPLACKTVEQLLHAQERHPPNDLTDTLFLLERLGERLEKHVGDLATALSVYEQLLLLRSRSLGDAHVDVAKSLMLVARILERQGNQEGSLDLYRHAQMIYTSQLQDLPLEASDVQDRMLPLAQSLLEQERYPEAIVYLNKILNTLEPNESSVDVAKIYYDLGRAHLSTGDHVSATVCLLEASKQPPGLSVTPDMLQLMLQQVDQVKRQGLLQNQQELHDMIDSKASSGSRRRRDATPLTAPLDGSEEASRRPEDDDGYKGGNDDDSDQDLASDYNDSDLDETGPQQIIQTNTSDVLSGIDSNDDVTPETASVPFDEMIHGLPPSSPLSSQPSQAKAVTATTAAATISIPVTNPRELTSPVELTPPEVFGKRTRSNTSSKSGGFTSRFRLSRRNKAGFDRLPEEKEIEFEDELKDLEQEYHTSGNTPFDGPIQFLSVPAIDTDDGVSQITMMFDDSRYGRHGQEWSFGVDAEGFGKWFPLSEHVNKVVEAAEGFLSAKAIHNKVKSAPLHAFSDDEHEESIAAESGIEMELVPNEAKDVVSDPESSHWSGKGLKPTSLAILEESSALNPSYLVKRKKENVEAGTEAMTKTIHEMKETRGSMHPTVAAALMELASLFRSAHSYQSAISAAQEALRIQKACNQPLGSSRALHMLAELYMQHGQDYKVALSHLTEALRIEKKECGQQSDRVAETLNQIGSVRSLQGHFGLAMDCHREALHILKDTHGDTVKDPLVSQTLCLIGSVYYRERNSPSTVKSSSGDYSTFIEVGMLEIIGRAHEDRGSFKMAIAFFEEKLQVLEEEGDREELVGAVNSLGMLSGRAGLYQEAVEYYERAMRLQIELGFEEVSLASTRVLISVVQYQLGYWSKSLGMLNEALGVLRHHLGDNETVAATLYHIGVVEAALCCFDSAMTALQDALDIQLDVLGDEHPATLRTLREIGNLYAVYEAELDSAFENFATVLKAQRKIHGDKHPNIAETLHCIGRAYARKKDFPKALRWLEECYYMRLEFLGVDHPQQATTLQELANIHLKRGRSKKALQICDSVIAIRRESLSEDHIDMASAIALRGMCLSARNEFANATKCFDDALKLAVASVGENHPFVAHVFVQHGMQHLRMCHFDEARFDSKKAAEIYSYAALDDDYPGIQESLELAERIERNEELFV